MSEIVSITLGVAANFPWKNPWVGAALAIVSAVIAYLFVPATVFTLVILTVSVVLAVLCAVMADEDEAAATIVGIYFSIVVGALAANFNIMPESHKCGIEDPVRGHECAQQKIYKFMGLNDLS